MKVSLKGLLDGPRGSAWPPSARAVKCPVKERGSASLSKTHVLLLVWQRARPVSTIANDLWDRALCRDCPGNREEGAGYGRSVCSESSRLHARNNGRDNGMQLRKEKLILQTRSQFGSRLETQPRDAGIPSNQSSSYSGEYVPAPCTHRPSSQPSRV